MLGHKGRKDSSRQESLELLRKIIKNGFKQELVDVTELKDHPKNYRFHPDDQIDHIVQSIKEHGIYRNVVVARDGTILAGHGVAKASRKLGLKKIPVIKLNIDPNSVEAMKIVIGDNEISHLADVDDRLFSENLMWVKNQDDLLGTGYDEKMLATLLMVTRPSSEIADFDEAAHWVGMPGFDVTADDKIRLIITFSDDKLRKEFVDKINLRIDLKGEKVWSTRWPWTDRKDTASVAFGNEKK